jgi:hypothetical protein
MGEIHQPQIIQLNISSDEENASTKQSKPFLNTFRCINLVIWMIENLLLILSSEEIYLSTGLVCTSFDVLFY